jgi:hypothetical protein
MGLCPWNDAALADRSAFGRMGHILGDSWGRGYALGVFAETVPASHPVYRFRSAPSMAETVFVDNGSADRFCYTEIATNDPLAPDKVRQRIRDRVIRSGDVVFLEDAGDHECDSNVRYDMLRELRAAVTERHDITCVLITTHDYSCTLNEQWDTVFVSTTMNQAVRDAALANVAQVGQTLLLDLDPKMDAWKNEAYGQRLLPVYGDNIHPNIWGQLFWTGEMLKVGGWRGMTSCLTAQSIAALNTGYTHYGSPYMGGGQTEIYVRQCLLR